MLKDKGQANEEWRGKRNRHRVEKEISRDTQKKKRDEEKKRGSEKYKEAGKQRCREPVRETGRLPGEQAFGWADTRPIQLHLYTDGDSGRE